MLMPRKRRFDFSNPDDVRRYQEFMRSNAARRQRMTKRCPSCQQDFQGWANQLYCSDACRQRAYYKRERNKTDQPPPAETT